MNPERDDLQWVKEILARYPKQEDSLIMVLQEINKRCNYLPYEALQMVSDELGVPDSKVYSVATFYRSFSLEPRGKTLIKVCLGTACHIRGGPDLVTEVSRLLHVAPGKTTSDGEYTLETVNCVGACAMAPLIVVGEKYHGNVRVSEVKDLFDGGDSREV